MTAPKAYEASGEGITAIWLPRYGSRKLGRAVIMNLRLAHKLIAEAEHEPRGYYVVRGREATREVRLMVEAGLIKATESDDSDPTEAIITRITRAGH